jgi:hypothetical protein
VSGTLSVIAASLPDQPSPPTLYSATTNQIVLSLPVVYNGGSPIVSYIIYMTSVGSSTSRRLQTVTYVDITATGTLDMTNLRFTTAPNLVTGTQYQFTIVAVNAVGQSLSSTSSAIMIAALVPTAPLSLIKVSSTQT